MSTATLDQLVSRVDTLPRLPDMSMRLIRVINDPSSSFAEIVDVIRFDQTVTTELLRMANSAYFSLAQKVTSVHEAVRFLGTNKIMQLVMAAHSHALLSPEQHGYGLMPHCLWTHSVGVALASQQLAKRLAIQQPGVLFTIGLLHDVGKIVLNEYVATEYAQIAALVANEQLTFFEAEGRVLGFTHAEVGALVAERWGLPRPIVDGIRYHHEPEAAPTPSPLIDGVHLADAACIVLGIGGGDDGLFYRADPNVVARYGLGETDVESVGPDVVAELKVVQELFASKK